MGLPSHNVQLAKPSSAGVYIRHRPETTLLYQVVQEYWPEFQAELASHGRYLPAHVTKEFDEYLKCGRLEFGFLRVRCESCHDEKLVAFSCKKRGFCPSCGARRMADSAALLVDEVLPHQPMRQWVLSVPFPLRFLFASNPKVMSRVLGIIYRAIAIHLAHKAGFAIPMAQTGAVTLIQRFGSALNLNIHFHMLFLEGVYIGGSNRHPVKFRRVKAPNTDELTRLTHTIAHRVGRYLVHQGLLEIDTGNIYLTPEAMNASDEDPTNQLLGSSITYRIAVGPQQGRKVFTLQTLPELESDNSFSNSVGEAAGFSLHAGVVARANERDKLERLCRYITRPALSNKRLSLTRNGQLRYELKTPWRNGTTHVIFEPLDFISRLVALVPRPRVNLTRFHGVFAPNSKYRAQVTPAKRGKSKKVKMPNKTHDQTPVERRASMTWAQRLKRVFDIDIETCRECGGDVKIIACIEDPEVIRKILACLDDHASLAATVLLPQCRAPPLADLLK
jgi:ribosomal protein S27E